MAETTERPWVLTETDIHHPIPDTEEWPHVGRLRHFSRADAELIVHRVNTYDELLSALVDIHAMADSDPTNLPPKMFASQIVSRCVAAISLARDTKAVAS